MSQWTHVAAILRIDCLRGLGLPGPVGQHPVEYMKEALPDGSEGPLHWQVWEDPMVEALAAYTVSVWGDLRDYKDRQEILDYFQQVCQGRMIRSGVLEIDVEYQDTRIYKYIVDNETNLDSGTWNRVYTEEN